MNNGKAVHVQQILENILDAQKLAAEALSGDLKVWQGNMIILLRFRAWQRELQLAEKLCQSRLGFPLEQVCIAGKVELELILERMPQIRKRACTVLNGERRKVQRGAVPLHEDECLEYVLCSLDYITIEAQTLATKMTEQREAMIARRELLRV